MGAVGVPGGVVVDSVGLVVVMVGVGIVGFLSVLGLTAGVVMAIRADSSRGARSPGAVVRRGRASAMNNAVGVWLGAGAGVGLGCEPGLSSSVLGASPGSGSTALDRTGPPARLTLIKPL